MYMTILSQADFVSEGATTIPQGSRVQVDSKRTASLIKDDDIVCPSKKLEEASRKRACRNTRVKYVVGSDHTMFAWNETSRRYVTEDCVFYLPGQTEWRSAPENKKQGSAGPIDATLGALYSEKLRHEHIRAIENYEKALEDGICAEQARLFLPAYGLYVRWRWTASLNSILHLLDERIAHKAQFEFQQYAQAVLKLTGVHFPFTIETFKDRHGI